VRQYSRQYSRQVQCSPWYQCDMVMLLQGLVQFVLVPYGICGVVLPWGCCTALGVLYCPGGVVLPWGCCTALGVLYCPGGVVLPWGCCTALGGLYCPGGVVLPWGGCTALGVSPTRGGDGGGALCCWFGLGGMGGFLLGTVQQGGG
jgi:hypothetical protein